MSKKPASPLQAAVSARLAAVQAELGYTSKQMAELVGTRRTNWTNWIIANNMPAEEAMVMLCDKLRLSMDWIYRGIPDQIPMALALRLEARLHGIDPGSAPTELPPDAGANSNSLSPGRSKEPTLSAAAIRRHQKA